jgi:hypothetical protein
VCRYTLGGGVGEGLSEESGVLSPDVKLSIRNTASDGYLRGARDAFCSPTLKEDANDVFCAFVWDMLV